MSAVLRQPEIIFRPMLEADIDDVLMVEQDAYEFPWTLVIFSDCLKAGHCCSVVVEQDHNIVGYGIMYLSMQEAHILNICIKPNVQNNGLGTRLLDYLLNLAKEHYANVIFLEVRPSNRAALKIYQSVGFNMVGNRRDYYPAKIGREDAWILAKQLTDECFSNKQSDEHTIG